MNLTFSIPDELATRLGAAEDLARRALDAFALAEYQAGRLTRLELRRLLSIGACCEFDSFLKGPGLNEGMTMAEFGRETFEAGEGR